MIKQESPPALTRKRLTDRGVTSPRYVPVGGGVPQSGTPPPPSPGGGYPSQVPPSPPGGGTPVRYSPPLPPGGVPQSGTPLPLPPGGVPCRGGYLANYRIGNPPPPPCGQTHKLKILPPLVLRTRSVIIFRR